MKKTILKTLLSVAAFIAFAGMVSAELPRLEFIDRSKGTARLLVGGKPFIILGGELLNSSGSTASDMSGKWEI